MTSWAELDAATAIPVVTITTSDAGLLNSGVRTSRTSLNTDSVADELITRTAAALGTDEEQVLEGEVLGEFLTETKVEDELGAGPSGAETDVLVVMVDDETSESVNTSIVATDVFSRGVSDFEDSISRFISITAGDETELGGNPGDITDMNSLDLSDGGDGDEHGDA